MGWSTWDLTISHHLHPYIPYILHFHEDDCSFFLIGLLSCICTPTVHYLSRYLSNPYKAYNRSCHASAQNPAMAPCHPEVNSKSSPWSTRPSRSGFWLALSLPDPFQPHWILNSSQMQQMPPGPLHLLFHLDWSSPTYSKGSLALSPSPSLSRSKGIKKPPCPPSLNSTLCYVLILTLLIFPVGLTSWYAEHWFISLSPCSNNVSFLKAKTAFCSFL